MNWEAILLWAIVWAIIGGLTTPFFYRQRGRHPATGLFVGIILGAVGGIILLIPIWLFLPHRGKKCPRCAETVRNEALVCKHCGHEFPPSAPTSSPPPISTNSQAATNHAAPLSPSRLLRSTITVMIGFTVTKLVSLGQVLIIADRFGARADYDTFVAANNAPERLVQFLGGGALAVAFIPLFGALLNRHDSEGAWRLASQVFNTLLVVTLTLSILIMITAPLLVDYIIAPGFSDAQSEQTVILLRILMFSTMIFVLSSLLTGILNGHNHFLLPVLAPIFQDLGLLFGVIFFTGPFGIYGLAWGVILGAVLHFGIQIPGLFIYKARWMPSLGWNDPRLQEVIRLMIPRMLASGVFAINFFAISNIASRMGEGALSAFGWGLRIMDIPEALIGTALGFVIFPTLSALTAQGRDDDRRQIFSEAIRFILVATIPAATGMILIGRPAVDIIFPDPDEAALVYAAVQIFAFAMILQATHEVVARAFYAQKDTVVPLWASVAGMFGNIAVLVIGFLIYDNVGGIPLAGPLGVGILPMGYLTAFVIELSILTVILQRRWGNIDQTRISITIRRTLATTAFMALPVLILDLGLSQFIFTEPSRIAGIIRTGTAGLIGVGAFIVGAIIFDLREVKQVPQMFRRRHDKI